MEKLADRVKRIREAKNLKQGDLAHAAKLDPAALSRILGGERDPRMDQLIEIAKALDVTVADLVGDTDAHHVLQEWVSMEQFAASETARLEALRNLELARVEISARLSEVEAMRATSQSQIARIAALEQDVARLRGDADDAKRLRVDLSESRQQQVRLEAERQRLSAESVAYARALAEANHRHQLCVRAYEEARGRCEVIQRDLASAKSGQVGALAIGALVGGLFGAMNEPSPRRGARRRA